MRLFRTGAAFFISKSIPYQSFFFLIITNIVLKNVKTSPFHHPASIPS